MSKKAFFKVAPIVALLSAIGFGAPAQATTFELGVVSSSSSVDVGNSVQGWFADAYSFTVAAGSQVTLSSLFSNIFTADAPGISNLWTTLYKSPGEFSQFGIGAVSTGSDGSSVKTATLNTGILSAGTYGLYVQGLVSPTGTASYTGNIAFDVGGGAGAGGGAVTPVPEPETWAMLMLGLAGMGFVARRRLNGSQTPADSHLA
jgi:hypothetical protein